MLADEEECRKTARGRGVDKASFSACFNAHGGFDHFSCACGDSDGFILSLLRVTKAEKLKFFSSLKRRGYGMFRGQEGFWKGRRGLGTVEIVIIIAVLVGLALIFRNAIVDFTVRIMDKVFNSEDVLENIDRSGFTTTIGG